MSKHNRLFDGIWKRVFGRPVQVGSDGLEREGTTYGCHHFMYYRPVVVVVPSFFPFCCSPLSFFSLVFAFFCFPLLVIYRFGCLFLKYRYTFAGIPTSAYSK